MTDERVERLNRIAALEGAMLNHLRFAMNYADIAIRHDEVFDHAGIMMSADKFLEHARDVHRKLTELRNLRGVTD